MNFVDWDKTVRGWQHAQSFSKVINPNLPNSVYEDETSGKGPKYVWKLFVKAESHLHKMNLKLLTGITVQIV